MNIYADRGNIAVLRARCEWRGIGFELGSATVGEPLDPDAHDLFYMGGGQDRDQVAVAHDMAAGKSDALHAPPTAARRCWRYAAATSCWATATRWATRSCPGIGLVDLRTVREDGPAPDRQLRHRGRPRHRPAHDRRLREPRRAHLPRRRRAEPLGKVLSGPRQQRPGRLRGRAARQRDRHLPARAAAAQERLAGRPADRAGARRRARAAGRQLEDAAHASARRAAGV